MSSVQERLQLKRVPLDKWSVQEQLCLASAVACSGDQNWMSVSRSLKMLCSANRPSDWFSQKSCAAQYGKLLENVETPKRKKRTVSERDNSAVETPSELIVRKLTRERIAELKKNMLDEQQQYIKLKKDIMAVQPADDNKLREMWNQIETENKQKEKERLLHSQWLKDREERKLEMERAWRPGAINVALSGVTGSVTPSPQSSIGSPKSSSQTLPQTAKAQLSLKIKTEDTIDIDEPLSQSSTSSNKQGTSPLLTSLLKSPSQTPNSTTSTTPTNVGPISVISQNLPSTLTRNSAPTITNLLTTAKPSTDVKSSLSTTSTQSGSVSLSMLLEPTDSDPIVEMESSVIKKEIKSEADLLPFTDLTEESPSSNENYSSKDDDQQLMEVFNGLIPDNIDELADILTQTSAIISLSPELLEESSILEHVDSLMDSNEEGEHESQNLDDVKEVNNDSKIQNLKTEDEVKEVWIDDAKTVKVEEDKEKFNVEKIDDATNKHNLKLEISTNTDVIIPMHEEIKTDTSETVQHNETIDSFDNQQTKDMLQQPSPQSSENDIMIIEDNTPPASELQVPTESENLSPLASKNYELIAENTKDEIMVDESKMVIEVIDENDQKQSKCANSEKSSKINSCDEKSHKSDHDTIEIVVKSNQSSIDKSDDDNFDDIKEEIHIIEDSKDIHDITQSISLIDTDDDSPIEVIKEDKIGKQKRDYSRKKLDNQKNEENIDDLNKANINLRMKLKERDRSESPFVLDDENEDIPRTRRRYSSTPNIDSIPNSPASSTATNDERDCKLWKKSILIAINRIQMHKYSSIFQKLEEQYTNYKLIIRPMDLITIKKNVETEVTRSTSEFQRDIMLMCSNLIFLNPKMYQTVKEFQQDALNTIDSTFDVTRKDEKISVSSGSTGGSSTSSNLNQSSTSPLISGKGRAGRKSSRMSNV